MHADDTDALLRLIAAGGPTAPRRQLLAFHTSPAAALAGGPRAWREAGLTDAQQTALQAPPPQGLVRSHDWLQATDHHLLGWHDPDYPALLRRAPSPPVALFVAGNTAGPFRDATGPLVGDIWAPGRALGR